MLAARLDSPDGPARAHALFAHCFTCGKEIFAASRIAQALVEKGIAVLRFDFTGLGHSEGEFANTNFSSSVQDLTAAAEWLRQGDRAPSLLIGHSLGGTAVLVAAGTMPEVRAVATIGAPSDVAHVSGLFREQVPEKRPRARRWCNSPGGRSGSGGNSWPTPPSRTSATMSASSTARC